MGGLSPASTTIAIFGPLAKLAELADMVEDRLPEDGDRQRSEEHEADDSVADDALIRPPVFVVEGGDVSVYDSLAGAMAALGGVDVEDGLYSVYDADGRRIL